MRSVEGESWGYLYPASSNQKSMADRMCYNSLPLLCSPIALHNFTFEKGWLIRIFYITCPKFRSDTTSKSTTYSVSTNINQGRNERWISLAMFYTHNDNDDDDSSVGWHWCFAKGGGLTFGAVNLKKRGSNWPSFCCCCLKIQLSSSGCSCTWFGCRNFHNVNSSKAKQFI